MILALYEPGVLTLSGNWYPSRYQDSNNLRQLVPSLSQCKYTTATRKSSCVTARGVPPVAYPVHGVCCPEGGWGGGTSDLGPDRGTPSPLERIWDQRKGRDPPPSPSVNRQTNWKHYLPVVLRTRTVMIFFSNIWPNETDLYVFASLASYKIERYK